MPLNKRTAAAGLAIAAIAALGVGGQAGTGEQSVKVKAGDTLGAIAKRHGVSITDLAHANGITNANHIVIGQTLRIPSSAGATTATPAAATHKVRAGENLGSIAARYDTTAAAIARANGIKNPNLVVIGATLAIPAASPTAATAGLPAKLLAHSERLALRPTFRQWASTYGVPADLLEAVAWIESGWQAGVVSRTNAVGIGQLMPATVDYMRVVIGNRALDPFDAEDNIQMSARMLAYLLRQNGGDVRLALGAYYQGLRSIREKGLFPETETYVAAVVATRPRFA